MPVPKRSQPKLSFVFIDMELWRLLTHTVLPVILVLILVSQVTCADESSTNITRTQQYDISDLYVNASRYLRHLLRQMIYFLSYETVGVIVFSVVNSDVIAATFHM